MLRVIPLSAQFGIVRHGVKHMLDVAHPKRGDALQLPLMADFSTDPIHSEEAP
jgi:hypothetical protein